MTYELFFAHDDDENVLPFLLLNPDELNVKKISTPRGASRNDVTYSIRLREERQMKSEIGFPGLV